MLEVTPILLVFADAEGNEVEWSPGQLVQDGTPISEDGEDMAYVGWKRGD